MTQLSLSPLCDDYLVVHCSDFDQAFFDPNKTEIVTKIINYARLVTVCRGGGGVGGSCVRANSTAMSFPPRFAERGFAARQGRDVPLQFQQAINWRIKVTYTHTHTAPAAAPQASCSVLLHPKADAVVSARRATHARCSFSRALRLSARRARLVLSLSLVPLKTIRP